MEVLGAVASSIAVVQALAAGKHVVSIIREVPDIQDDFHYLMKELTLVKSMAKAISRMPPSAYEQDLIDAAAQDLNELTKELEDLLQSCAREVHAKDNKTYKTRKRKWLLEKSTIKKLQQRMTNAKNTLHFAVTSSRATNDAQFQAEIRHMFISLHSRHTVNDDTLDAASKDESVRDQVTNGSGSSALEAISSNDKDRARMNDSVSVKSLTLVREPSSSASCQCRCHFTERQYNSSGWVESLFGSWLVRCKSRSQECSNPDCQCINPTVLKLEYSVPRWLVFRSLAVFASYNSLSGLSCSLRPFTLLDRDSPLWYYQKCTSQMVQKSVMYYGVHPNDSDTAGFGLIECALMLRLYTAIEVLLNLWGNVLAEIGLSRRTVCRAHAILSEDELSDHDVYLLQKLIKYAGYHSEETTTKLHMAIRQGKGLQAALENQPWAIDTVDATGNTPLTLAIECNQVIFMKSLISAGANVNQLLPNGASALTIAAWSEYPEAVRLLLRAKSRVDCASLLGVTALHIASFACNPESVSLLLAAGSSATDRDINGDTPLHYLTRDSGTNFDNINQIVEMLAIAGADLEAQNKRGFTPVLYSLRYGNAIAMRCLLKTGCSLSTPSTSLSLLHSAGMYASLDMLKYLDSLGLSDIDPYRKDAWGDSPWDAFIRALNGFKQEIFYSRTPTNAEGRAFVELYQGIRNRYLRHDISNLEQVLDGLRAYDVTTSREYLLALLAKKKDWGDRPLVSWYQAVDKRIQYLEWDLAIEDVHEYLTELKEELDMPVWRTPSKYGYMAPPDQSLTGDLELEILE